MPKTVGVAVSNATFHFDKLYTYAVMPDQQDTVKLGSMVLVPFGRGSRARMGVVLACDAEPESAKLKYLFDVAPASACLTPELLRLVHFLKERTFCTYYEAVKAVIPYGAQYKPAVAADGVTPVLQKQLTRHTENSYRLVSGLPQKPKPTAKQLAAVALLGGGPRTLNELEDKGISRAVLDNLCAKGVLECSKVNKSIDLYSSIPLKNEPICLTAEQQAAYDALLPKLEDDAPHSALLYGVTGSGKTLVFLKLIAHCLEQGRKALVLVPEISLTPQMILRLKSQFGRRKTSGSLSSMKSRSTPTVRSLRPAILPTKWPGSVQRRTVHCFCWPAPPPAPRAFTRPSMAAPSWCGLPSATAATRCRRCRSWICAPSWHRATPGRSALPWRTLSAAIWTQASRLFCC